MYSELSYRHSPRESRKKVPPESRPKSRFRETLDTAILGSLSSSVGIVVLIVVMSGLIGRRVSDWHEDKFIYTTRVINYLEPSSTCAVATVVGEILGLAGIALAWNRRRTISPLSTIGTLTCLLHMFLFFIQIFNVWLLS
jgi:hypothetical protein